MLSNFIKKHLDDLKKMEEEDANNIQVILAIAESDDDEEVMQHGGSRPGRTANINREPLRFHNQLVEDYFAERPRYGDELFRRRFRMSKTLFLCIVNDIEEHDDYFKQKPDATKRMGFSSLQKCTAAIRLLAYGFAADLADELYKISESTALESLERFCINVDQLYGKEWLRAPNKDDVKHLMAINAQRGFPGMLGSIDCMHWHWKNCPVALAGQYEGKEGGPTIVLEAIASQDLHIWHAFFGMPGSCNDINIIDHSPFLTDLAMGHIATHPWTLQGRQHERGYYLADGIYPDWAIFIKTISQPQGQKRQWFSKQQEAARKDVERAFGVLQAHWQIIQHPCRLWSERKMAIIMRACIILHNMIIHDHRDQDIIDVYIQEPAPIELTPQQHQDPAYGTFAYLMQQRGSIKDATDCSALREDLIEHLWELKGQEQ
jgi:hypothetical protein